MNVSKQMYIYRERKNIGVTSFIFECCLSHDVVISEMYCSILTKSLESSAGNLVDRLVSYQLLWLAVISQLYLYCETCSYRYHAKAQF